MSYTYDEIYGISIDEYLKEHNITIDKLIRQVETDIEILERNLRKVVRESEKVDWNLASAIKKKQEQKRQHLKRLKEYTRKNK